MNNGQAWLQFLCNMVKIEVFYPEADGKPFKEDDIAALRRFESVIVERAVALFVSTSSYRWEQDPAVKSDVYARLVKKVDGSEILSESLAFWHKCPVDRFEVLLVKRSGPSSL